MKFPVTTMAHRTLQSPITMQEFEVMRQSAAFDEEDEQWLRVAGEVLADRAKALAGKWRDIIAAHPHLARYSQRPDGEKDPHCSETSGPASSTVDSRYLSAAIRPGLVELSAGNGAAAHEP